MDNNNNPWQTESSHGNPWSSDNASSRATNTNSNTSTNPLHQPLSQHPPNTSTSYSQSQDPWQQSAPPPQPSYGGFSSQNQASPPPIPNEQNAWSSQPSQSPYSYGNDGGYQPPSGPPPGQQQYSSYPNEEPRPALPPRRTDTDTARLLASQPDSGEQLEHMQHYEASKPQTEDERNQASLQKQFPSIDSSLIAAIYNDYKDSQGGGAVDLGSVREMLQELQS